jgi:hypothetical protein
MENSALPPMRRPRAGRITVMLRGAGGQLQGVDSEYWPVTFCSLESRGNAPSVPASAPALRATGIPAAPSSNAFDSSSARCGLRRGGVSRCRCRWPRTNRSPPVQLRGSGCLQVERIEALPREQPPWTRASAVCQLMRGLGAMQALERFDCDAQESVTVSLPVQVAQQSRIWTACSCLLSTARAPQSADLNLNDSDVADFVRPSPNHPIESQQLGSTRPGEGVNYLGPAAGGVIFMNTPT